MVRHNSIDDMPANWHIAKLDSLRGRGPVREDEKRSILRVFYTLKKEKNESESSSDSFNIRTRTAELFGRGEATISRIVSRWIRSNYETQGEVSDPYLSALSTRCPGNRVAKFKRIKDTEELFLETRDFVVQKRNNGERITAREVLHYMIEKKVVDIRTNPDGSYDVKDMNAAYRSVQRYLSRVGFQRGKRSKNIRMNPEHLILRNHYLCEIIKNRSKPKEERLNEVYTDESYIHHHHKFVHENLYHGEDVYSDKSQHKGRRMCFVAAIETNGLKDDTRLVTGSMWAFCPSNKRDHKGDYHKVFNNENYLNWFTTQLLPNLSGPSLIIMDNAKYHKSKPDGTPNASKLKKSELLTWLKIFCIEHDVGITAIEAKKLLRTYVNTNIKAAIVQKAEEAGHRVIFTPPHYSDLQPIELVWARVKGNIGRQYTNSTTMTEVKERLYHQFELLHTVEGREAIFSICRHVDSIVEKLVEEIEQSEIDEMISVDEDSDFDEIGEDCDRTVSDNSTVSDISIE